MTGEEFIKDICSKADVNDSELVDVYNNPGDDALKHNMFHSMIDSIIKIKEENNSVNNPYIDTYAALVCIERLSMIVSNSHAYIELNDKLAVAQKKHDDMIKNVILRNETNNE